MQKPNQQSPEQKFHVVTTIWGAFIVACGSMAVIAYLTKGAGAETAPTLAESFKNPMMIPIGAIAVFNLILSQILPRFMIQPGTKGDHILAFKSFVLQAVLIETIAIFGLVGTMVTGQPMISYVASGIAIFGLLLAKPARANYTTTSSSMR
jgi:hydrogenase-4 membrane subunit HyfE